MRGLGSSYPSFANLDPAHAIGMRTWRVDIGIVVYRVK